MICKYCGGEIENDAEFCYHCGEDVLEEDNAEQRKKAAPAVKNSKSDNLVQPNKSVNNGAYAIGILSYALMAVSCFLPFLSVSAFWQTAKSTIYEAYTAIGAKPIEILVIICMAVLGIFVLFRGKISCVCSIILTAFCVGYPLIEYSEEVKQLSYASSSLEIGGILLLVSGVMLILASIFKMMTYTEGNK